MAARVTTEEVLEIVDTTLTDVDSQIGIATVIVDELLADETLLSDDMLEKIELLLSAHFVQLYTPQRKSEKLGDATDAYHLGKLDMGFQSTAFGQQAVALDISGKLKNAGKVRATVKAIDLEL